MKKKTILDLYDMKKKGEIATWMTAYDYPMASFAEQAGIDMILVGDSLGMIVLGYDGTVPVTMEDEISHCKAVRRGAPSTFIIGDMPFGSYQESTEQAVRNAVRFLKEADVDAIKLEGGIRVADKIKAIVDAGIVVFGHIGLTPQSSGAQGGFKAQGRNAESARYVIEDAIAVEKAGAQALLIEGVPDEITAFIKELLSIPVYSIGAGISADGQLLICGDFLGMFQEFTPKFVKKYASIAEVAIGGIKDYINEVKNKEFPKDEHCYHIIKGEEDKVKKLFEEYK
ncbi:3-methyl-2-oxobutanoate hydroxymethyltransferase [Miniphocaeibacter halophilus]|uniref:3-methyl-2-oxobutanoate hydroxymethyltransferase n=1 Tax=Miniphocaeibacter halophilus TaxID=2931922 RepID=A0AC61N1N1_9FIRM|nr:3-methyl-2-oxobutanoate hydroxymethyltransferase [Miniphocaeibacter halophilus]QQK08763.1 3-methyl-2-oxobutanoate hydroxymethyltransferase [Miniphocaeibacter halophilus]